MARKDLITLLAGDPMAKVEQGQEYAKANLAQYKHQKEIVEEINAALKAAEKKSKKKKGLYGLGGSLLGGLLGVGANMLFPGMGVLGQRAVQGILGGLASGAAEKYRQDKYDVTKELEDVKKKFKGRKQENKIGETIESLEDSLEDSMKTAATVSAIMSAAMPTNIGKGAKFDPTKAVSDTNIPGPFSGVVEVVEPTATMVPGPDIMLAAPESIGTSFSAPSGVPSFNVNMPLIEAVTPEWLSGLAVDMPKSLLDSVLGQVAMGTTRLAGPSAYQEYLSNEWESSPYTPAPFINTYGQKTGGY